MTECTCEQLEFDGLGRRVVVRAAQRDEPALAGPRPVGAQVRVSMRRVVIALSEAFPAQDICIQAARNLGAVPIDVGPG